MIESAPVKMAEKLNNSTAAADDDDYKPHILRRSGGDPDTHFLDRLLGYDGVDILTIKVENDAQLSQMAMQTFRSLKHVLEDGSEHVATLGAHFRNMLRCPTFINAFLEAEKEDCFMMGDIALFSNSDEDEQRLEKLKNDCLLGQILQETETTSNIRGVLNIIMGYWSDREFFNKIDGEIAKEKLKKAKPRQPHVVEWEERITDILYPSNAQGLKLAMATKYSGDAYKRICEQIDNKSAEYDCYLNFHDFGRPDLVGKPPPNMTWVSIVWRNFETFYVRAVGYGLPPAIPVCNDY